MRRNKPIATPADALKDRKWKITGIKKHRGAGMWYGFAVEGGKRFQWYYRPRSLFHMSEEEGSIPNCWMNVDPPVGAKRAILKAIREAKVS